MTDPIPTPPNRTQRRFGSTVHRPVPRAPAELVATEPDEPATVDARSEVPVPTTTPDTGPRAEPAQAPAADDDGFFAAVLTRPSADPPVVGPPDRPAGARRRLPILIAAIAAVAIVIAVVVVALTRSGDASDQPATGDAAAGTPTATVAPTIAAQRDQLVDWMTSALAPAAVIVADPDTATTLRAAGFTAVKADNALAGLDWHGVDYVISVPGRDTASTTRTELVASSVPLAIFGPGTAVSVAQVFPGGTAAITARQATNQRNRVQAGAQLPANPNLRFDGDARAVVVRGGLDLRPAAVLAALAQTGTVWVRAIDEDAAEVRAGQPARMLTVTVVDPQGVQSALAGLPPLYKPVAVSVISQGTLRLVWVPAVAAVVGEGG